jgi:hypothetical protein
VLLSGEPMDIVILGEVHLVPDDHRITIERGVRQS